MKQALYVFSLLIAVVGLSFITISILRDFQQTNFFDHAFRHLGTDGLDSKLMGIGVLLLMIGIGSLFFFKSKFGPSIFETTRARPTQENCEKMWKKRGLSKNWHDDKFDCVNDAATATHNLY